MQPQESVHPVSLSHALRKGLFFACMFGLPLYGSCALWFGFLFPTQNYTIATETVLAFSSLAITALGILFVGCFIAGKSLSQQTGNRYTGMISGTWMGVAGTFIVWGVREVSTRIGPPMVTFPGNPVRGQFVFGLVYTLFPSCLVLGGLVFGAIGGAIGIRRTKRTLR